MFLLVLLIGKKRVFWCFKFLRWKTSRFHRENCGRTEMKRIRKLYARPSMMPSMIELSKANWILVSFNNQNNHSNWQNTSFKQVTWIQESLDLLYPIALHKIQASYSTELLVIVQIHGSIQVKLSARDCRSLCPQVGPFQLRQHQLGKTRDENDFEWSKSNHVMVSPLVMINVKYWHISYRPSTVDSQEEESSNKGTINLSLAVGGVHQWTRAIRITRIHEVLIMLRVNWYTRIQATCSGPLLS